MQSKGEDKSITSQKNGQKKTLDTRFKHSRRISVDAYAMKPKTNAVVEEQLNLER